MKKTKLCLLFLVISLLLLNSYSYSQVQITLRKSFIDSIKNKVTYSGLFNIVKAHKKPNSAAKDGDLHIACYEKIIGMPVVAEIMNAKNEAKARNIVKQNVGTDSLVEIQGAWRLWCEHAGSEGNHIQGGEFPPITNSNPDHVFEIHPVTNIAGINTIKSLKPTSGYKYKDAEDAFYSYSNAHCNLTDNDETVTIESNGVGFNYVDFKIEILDEPQLEAEDGIFVFCKVLDIHEEIISQKMRMAFPKDSKAEKKLKTLAAGDKLRVIGIPRISLAVVSFRIENQRNDPGILRWNLPVEMIIVGLK